jgi:hypothetical protein
MIYGGPGFSQSFSSTPTPSPHLSCKEARAANHRKTKKERQLADVRGGKGWAWSRMIGHAKKPDPLLIIQFSLEGGGWSQIRRQQKNVASFIVFSLRLAGLPFQLSNLRPARTEESAAYNYLNAQA